MRRCLFALLLAGCGDSAQSMMGDLAQLMDLSVAHDFAQLPSQDLLTSSAYPAGPYGNKVGNVIPNLSWIGYDDPLADALASSKPYAAYTMNDLRLSGSKYGVVHVAYFF
jgi:hypothetical protein